METPGTDDAQALAEEAEAEALAAEAAAAAALARARALKLRRRADAAAAGPAPSSEDAVAVDAQPDDLARIDGATEVPLGCEDADEPAVDEPNAVEPAKSKRGRRWSRVPHVGPRRIAAALAVVGTLGFLGASGYMVVHHDHVVAEQRQAAEFTAAARQGVVTLMSLDYNDAQDVVKRILDNTTGEFRNDFQSQADEFAKVAQSSRVITEATVNATAVQSMTTDTGTVLVAVTTQVSNAASKEQQPRTWRLRVDLARDGGQLKLAKVEFVP